jgi:hypothetical protein
VTVLVNLLMFFGTVYVPGPWIVPQRSDYTRSEEQNFKITSDQRAVLRLSVALMFYIEFMHFCLFLLIKCPFEFSLFVLQIFPISFSFLLSFL